MNDPSLLKKTLFMSTELENPITEFAFGITAVYDGNYFASGTAMIIAPCLAITAAHVIEDFVNKFENIKISFNSEFHFESSFDIQVFQIVNLGRNIKIWNVRKLWVCNYTDIAILHLLPLSVDNDQVLLFPKIDLYPPKIGETISAFGYRNPKTKLENDILKWEVDPIASKGIVKDVHLEKRDSSRLNFPCFQTNARFDGSMSGGPVFNSKGKLCGLICSNMPPFDKNDEDISYVTMLWPMMNTKIDINREGFKSNITYPLLDLAKDGFLHANGWENIVLGYNDENKTSRIFFNIPNKFL